jgi:hypothetical protein
LLLSVAGMRQVSLEALKPAYVALLNSGLSSPRQSLFASAASVNGARTSASGHQKGDL